MTYCVGIMTKGGVVMASDSRTNAGYDQVNTCRKMYLFNHPGERAFVILTSGSLSLTQSIMTILQEAFDAGEGLAKASSLYAAARVIGDAVREVAELDRAALERDDYRFNVHLLLGGQVQGEAPGLYMIYPQGNPLSATEESPYLQIGECKYGRPILDRGISAATTTPESAAMYALLSFDATMRSNVTVGPPIEVVIYRTDKLRFDEYRKFAADDLELNLIHAQWEQSLRRAVEELPKITFNTSLPELPLRTQKS